jgi:hypothetical protein
VAPSDTPCHTIGVSKRTFCDADRQIVPGLIMPVVPIIPICADGICEPCLKSLNRIEFLGIYEVPMTPLRQRMIDDMRLRNFSPHTAKNYLKAVERLAKHFGLSPDKISQEQIRQYLLYLIHERKIAWSTYNVTRCALKFLYEVTLRRTEAFQAIPCPKGEKRLPVVLSFDEVARFFDACQSPRHLTMFLCGYAGGMRVSEVVNLRVKDIDSQRMVIHIRQSKGWRDRYVPLSPRLLDALHEPADSSRPNGCFPASRRSNRSIHSFAPANTSAKKRGLGNVSRCTPCGTAMPPTCWKPASTCGRFNSCLVIATSRRQLYIRTSPRNAWLRRPAR